MTTRDVDTILAVVLSNDLREQLETASTLPPPPPATYVETPWDFAGLRVVISGKVAGDEVRTFSCETEDGLPLRVPDSHMPAALEHLIAIARKDTAS